MDYKKLIERLGFTPKENTSGIYRKKYASCDGYGIEVDFDKQTIDYGNLITSDSKTTQNLSQPENFVVLECADKLLSKGYKPENIILEKTYPAGHGTSGRLDICVTRDDGSEYLLIECKTYGKEFEKEFARMKRDGGQLFTYFKFSNKADVIMLYASEPKGNEIVYRNEIVKIEDDYRTGDVKDFYEKWNKLSKDNGVWESPPYNFTPKAYTIEKLEDIKPEDSSFIFNRFLEIFRHNVVSDKPNAFNKIFTLFLCKIYDEKDKEGTDEELDFQWIEGKDDDVSFQLRLTDLYKNGMECFLEKKVTDFSDEEFENQYASLFIGNDDLKKKFKENVLYKLRLEKNNEFAIKEVYDEKSFKENAKVVKEVVELLQKYKIRYTKKQQYLSDFFELLLTTGLKQESGQFFTPVPVAQFIIRSLPIDKIVNEKLIGGKPNDLLPYIIDYAAGSGHFLTESMHEIQRLLINADIKSLKSEAKSFIDVSKIRHFDWAEQYVYGIEKDYRLVKVVKVGCYLHGDGLANVIHSDGLANFKHSDYKEKLKETDKDFTKENKQFDVLVSNPPYSVAAFKNAAREYYGGEDFELYNSLTDNSSEIECLFIERSKQLIKDGGVAGVILPSSILSNSGIYTKAREIILQYFDIIAITELGSNTFMATGTNTVVLFLRRRSNYTSINLRKSVDRFFADWQDVTLNGVEKPVAKYVNRVWEGISFSDYLTLLQKTPNQAIEAHEIYREYRNKISSKTEKDFWNTVVELEKEKLFYFILTYPQKTVLVKTGEKDAEKRFLGYEFSNRRGSEGIHPIQRGKTIDECTKLFDENRFINDEKASTYIYKAFANDYEYPIHESLKENISRVHLVDMLTFDRVNFEKNISTSIKKKVKIESKYEIKRLKEVSIIDYGTRIVKKSEQGTIYPVYGGGGETFKANTFNRENVYIISRFGMSPNCVRFIEGKFFLNDSGMSLNSINNEITNPKYLDYYLFLNQDIVYDCGRGVAQKNIDIDLFNNIQIPLPPKDIQEKIIAEIEVLEKTEEEAKEEIGKLRKDITEKANNLFGKYKSEKLGLLSNEPVYGANESAVVGNSKTDYRYVRITDIDDNGTLNDDWKTAAKVEDKYILKQGDFLFARSGATAGKTFLYNKKYGKALYAGYLIKFETKKDLLFPEFLNFILKSDNYTSWVLKNRQGTAQPNINAQQFSSFEIPLPPLSEQQKIVAGIEKIEIQISELEQQLAAIPKQKEEVLKKYLITLTSTPQSPQSSPPYSTHNPTNGYKAPVFPFL
ncbi:restriction endonuclease subunit S [Viscerimonas tarda]